MRYFEKVYNKASELIGNTPIINVNGIWVKCEFMNPTGSSKDRIAYRMIQNTADTHIVEATSGNTGVSVAFICATMNLRCTIFCPSSTSQKKIRAMRYYGAKIEYASTIYDAVERAKKYAKKHKNCKYLNQFVNRYNPKAQQELAWEIFNQLGFMPDAIVCGIGTSGTLAALSYVFNDTIFFTPIPTDYQIEGICDGVSLPLRPKNCNLTLYDVERHELIDAKIELRKAGLYVGDSTAANYAIAKCIKKHYKSVVIIAHDSGWHY
jgi:cysteine synthase A